MWKHKPKSYSIKISVLTKERWTMMEFVHAAQEWGCKHHKSLQELMRMENTKMYWFPFPTRNNEGDSKTLFFLKTHTKLKCFFQEMYVIYVSHGHVSDLYGRIQKWRHFYQNLAFDLSIPNFISGKEHYANGTWATKSKRCILLCKEQHKREQHIMYYIALRHIKSK